ncbi:uncharacterized protein LOC119121608 [Syngnathus acus]|uniref:uncharacterized protein LOC119121608 n=1 Tax=Syngnathus acus TaxID=161584 RepID=UPI001885FF8A|nr:uncharacterized protein LOC119121608 [Syngnathus acus]
MNFSKLLCLVLVCSEPFGQVLAAEQTGETCTGTAGTTVTCKRKKDETVKLTIAGTANNPVRWKKGTTTISAQAAKYELDGDKNKILTILNLKEGDEETYTAEGTSPVEKFQVQVVDCLGGKTSEPAGLCQGKPGGSIKLGLSDDGSGTSLSWKKGTDTIAISGDKYGPVNEATLMIKNLDDADEKEFTGGPTGSEEKFSVQVADCFGATGTVQCQGKLNEALKLRISDAVSGSKVVWTKEEGVVPASSQKLGTKDEGLKFPSLAPADAGTYKATYGGNTVSFAVRIPDTKGTSESDTKKESTENGKDNSGGGGSSNSGTDQVNLDKGNGGGLSYSPALLVTVTLVHLLLQLAA